MWFNAHGHQRVSVQNDVPKRFAQLARRAVECGATLGVQRCEASRVLDLGGDDSGTHSLFGLLARSVEAVQRLLRELREFLAHSGSQRSAGLPTSAAPRAGASIGATAAVVLASAAAGLAAAGAAAALSALGANENWNLGFSAAIVAVGARMPSQHSKSHRKVVGATRQRQRRERASAAATTQPRHSHNRRAADASGARAKALTFAKNAAWWRRTHAAENGAVRDDCCAQRAERARVRREESSSTGSACAG